MACPPDEFLRAIEGSGTPRQNGPALSFPPYGAARWIPARHGQKSYG